MGGQFIRGFIIVWAAVGCCLPSTVLASETPAPSSAVTADVALRDGNVLLGQVVNPQGIAQTGLPVLVLRGDQALVRTTTDANGYFAVRGLPGGVYQIATPESCGTFRVWTEGTAPPSAQPGALVIHGDQTMRARNGGALRYWLCQPAVIAGVVATAVAVPLVLADDDEPASP